MLTPAQRQELKGLAHPLKPVVLVGDKGLGPTVYAEIDRALRVHELMKIRVGGEDREERGAAMASICKELNAEAVQIIGKTLVIYRAMTQEEREAMVAKQVERKQRRIKVARRAEIERKDAEAAARPRVAARPMRVGTKRSRLSDSPIRGQAVPEETRPARNRPAPQEASVYEPRRAAPRRTDSFGNNYGERADNRRSRVRDEQAAPPAETAGSRFGRNSGAGARPPAQDPRPARSPARTPTTAGARPPRSGSPRPRTK